MNGICGACQAPLIYDAPNFRFVHDDDPDHGDQRTRRIWCQSNGKCVWAGSLWKITLTGERAPVLS